MNAKSVLPILFQLAEAAGGNPAAIAGLVTKGIGAVTNFRSAKTDEERLAAGQQLFGVVKDFREQAEGQPLTAEETAALQAEIDSDTALLSKKFDFTYGGG